MPAPNGTDLGPILLKLARRAIQAHLGSWVDAPNAAETALDGESGLPAEAQPPVSMTDGVAPPFAAFLDGADRIQVEALLAERGATFVTLIHGGALRGCIGSLRAQRPLGEDVVANAIAAATCDPRFPPLEAGELARIRIEVSVLSSPRFLEFADEEDLLRQLRPSEDGLILFSGCRSATFLPQVWRQLPEPHAFLAALKQKAGLAPDRPAANLVAAAYTVDKWTEDDTPADAPPPVGLEPEVAP